jgi:hypothetical protein
MTTSDADMRKRLSEIWTEWGLSPGEAESQAQHRAADAVAAWIERGKSDPEIAIRAVQIMLADPERPDVRRRKCWKDLRDAVTEVWTNAGTGDGHVAYGQALLLAAWPQEAQVGWLTLAPLLDSAWDLTRGKDRQLFERWRSELRSTGAAGEQAVTESPAAKLPGSGIMPFGGVTLTSASAIERINQKLQTNNFNTAGSHVVQVLTDHESALQNISAALVRISQEAAQFGQVLTTFLDQVARQEIAQIQEQALSSHGELDLLWWGQARYCHALKTPYRRMRSDADALLWWAASEAAALSLRLPVEPAAAYLVETLDDLDQDVFEKKTLIDWMQRFHAALTLAGDKVPRLSDRLAEIAHGDPLGLPVTWVRRQAARKEPLTDAANAVALDLDQEIDRGEWASWIFRETLLDLHLRTEGA